MPNFFELKKAYKRIIIIDWGGDHMKTNRNIIIILIIVLAILGSILWYRELGTNREVPKRAQYVYIFQLRGGDKNG